MKLTFTEDTNLEQKRRECLDYLNRTKVDVGLTSSASATPGCCESSQGKTADCVSCPERHRANSSTASVI